MEAHQAAVAQKLAAGVVSGGVKNPVIQAHQNSCLSQGTLEMLASPDGIPLVCTSAPVILLLPYPPIRNVKYHVPSKPPRFTRDRVGMPTFEGGEHTAIGDGALLYFSE